MFISEKSINFAVVNELSKHIEILLLSNDCVIVPGLGGFMAHHIAAHYDENECLFLPPLRTIGFNPQLKMNDSLLAQSYIEAFDLSYPEAIRRIEDEVKDIIQTIHNEGSYELTGIGTLSLNDEGNYIFSPAEAGILTPSLYGLSSFEFPYIAQYSNISETPSQPIIKAASKPEIKEAEPVTAISEEAENTEESAEAPLIPIVDDDDDDEEKAIVIKMSWIRNAVAVAVAVIAFILVTTPVSNSEMSNIASANINTSIFDTALKNKATSLNEIKDTIKDSIKSALAKIDSTESALIPSDSIQTAKALTENDTVATKKVTTYCLVLASYVSKKNANAFVEQLHKRGFTEAEVYIRNNVTRVIYGNFNSLNDAYNRLNRIRGNKDFEEAWVLKTTDRG